MGIYISNTISCNDRNVVPDWSVSYCYDLCSQYFFSAEWHHAVLVKLCSIIDKWHLLMLNNINELVLKISKPKKKLFKIFLVRFFAFQLLFPMRHFLYLGNIFWTEQGCRFSWRVMLLEQSGVATFYVKDGQSGR